MNVRQRLDANRLFLNDVGVGLLVLNDLRRRYVSRVFGLSGLSPRESLLITVLAMGALAKMAEEASPTVGRPPSASPVGLVIGGTLISDAVHAVGGVAGRKTPGFAALIAFALIWKYHPLARAGIGIARESIHAAEASERRIERVYASRAEHHHVNPQT